jgi:hypothetical protein
MKRLFVLLTLLAVSASAFAGNYKNFRVAVYIMVQDVNRMTDTGALEATWAEFTKNLKVDKVYLETFRDMTFVDEAALQNAIEFFRSKGVEMMGGITYNFSGGTRMRWETVCYSNPEHRAIVKKVSELTARYFDEFVLDDYYFTNCKCDLCIAAKGDRTWSEFRNRLLDDAAKELIVGPAKAVNPDARVIVKYPNWYEHFQGLGFDLEHGPYTFDGVYTGTETRNPEGEQHLQPYESFAIFKYFENLRPGYNRGGWVDTGGLAYLDMFPEQLWMTLLAKSPEITLFNYGGMRMPVRVPPHRPWAGAKTTFDLEDMKKVSASRGVENPTWGRVAEYSFEQVDKMLGSLGDPRGIMSYKPFHSIGEDFLINYMGMAGMPMELTSEFPEEAKMIFLSETAKYDPDIVAKIKNQLKNGKDVMITSGLFRALQDKGIQDIVEMTYTDRKADVETFVVGRGRYTADAKIKIPQFTYHTNDSWEDISSLDYGNGWPVLQQIAYSNGNMFVWVVPENFSHIYALPAEVLDRLRSVLSYDVPVRIEGPSQVALFTYDDGSFVVESFRDEPTKINVVTRGASKSIVDVVTGRKYGGTDGPGDRIYGRTATPVTRYEVTIPPHSIVGFNIDR